MLRIQTNPIYKHVLRHNTDYGAVRKKWVLSVQQGATHRHTHRQKRDFHCNTVLKILLIIVQCGSKGRGIVLARVLPCIQGTH